MLLIKGIIIGIGKIIPGVSGSMLAISLGVYQKMIDSINNFFKDPIKNAKFLSKIGLGIIISVLFFSKTIVIALNNSYIITIFFFIGLIIGSLGDLKNNVIKNNNLISSIIFISVLFLGLLNIDNNIKINNIFFNTFFYIFIGFVDALTMIIPGISGTATLMMLGAYNTIMNSLSNISNLSMMLENIKILIPFFIGMIIGIIITAKLIDYLFKNYKSTTFSAIIGFTLSTIALMAIRCFKTNYTFIELVIAFILLIIGIMITRIISKFSN